MLIYLVADVIVFKTPNPKLSTTDRIFKALSHDNYMTTILMYCCNLLICDIFLLSVEIVHIL